MRLEVGEHNLVGREKELATLQRLYTAISTTTRTTGDDDEEGDASEMTEEEPTSHAASCCCLVHGASGSGKTSLVTHAYNTLNASSSLTTTTTATTVSSTSSSSSITTRPYFVRGKYDQYKGDFSSPHSEIVAALEELTKQAPHEHIRNCLTTEARILTRLVPSFRTMTMAPTSSSLSISTSPDDKDDDDILTLASERLTVALQVFFREFCTPKHPLILFLDDLQWSDPNSCYLLENILNDTSIHHFLFVGCYRDDDNGGRTATNNKFVDIITRRRHHNNNDGEDALTFTDLPVGPLDVEDVDCLIGQIIDITKSTTTTNTAATAVVSGIKNNNLPSSSISQQDSVTSSTTGTTTSSSLGPLIHKKTSGNPYFVIQYLQELESKELLTYNYVTKNWQWDASEIANGYGDDSNTMMVARGVVDVLRGRVERLAPETRNCLIVAAFLGFVVNIDLLQSLAQSNVVMECLVTEAKGKQPSSSSDAAVAKGMDSEVFSNAWKELQEEGLVEIHGTDGRFSHDRIHECTYNLVPEQVRAVLHHRIGTHIWSNYWKEDSMYVFLAAEQLNRGGALSSCDKTERERLFLIELNYKAGMAAKSRVGIEAVAMFLGEAVNNVADDSYWDRSYPLLLDLFSFAAEVEFSRGRFDQSDTYIDTVLRFATTDRDTARVRVARALACGVKRDFERGIQESRGLLSLLGVKMPASSTINFLLELYRTKRDLKKMKCNDFLSLKTIQSEDMLLAMKILQHGSIFGWNSDTTFAGLCYLRMIRLTAKFGFCETTPYALAGYGFLLASLGQEQEAFRFSQVALESTRSTHAQPEVNMMVHAFLAHFECPAAHSLEPLLGGYRTGLETGSMMCGTICVSIYAHVYLFSGLSLHSFSRDMNKFARQFKLCHQDIALAYILPAMKFALNLSGKTSDPLDISRDSMQDLEGFQETMFIETATEDPTVLCVYYLQGFTAYLLGDRKKAEGALSKILLRRTKRLEGTQIFNLFFILCDGLVSFALCRSRSMNKHRKVGRSAIKDMEKLAKKRSINCGGLLSLLRAEDASLDERNADTVKRMYDAVSIQL